MSTKNPLKWVDDTKAKLAAGAKELADLRDALGRVHNTIGEVRKDKTASHTLLKELQAEKAQVDSMIATRKAGVGKLRKELESLSKETEDLTQLKESFVDLRDLSLKDKADAEKGLTLSRAEVDALKKLAGDHERERVTVNASLSELRRDILPRYQLQNTILGAYGGASVLDQPLVMLNQLQVFLGKFLMLIFVLVMMCQLVNHLFLFFCFCCRWHSR